MFAEFPVDYISYLILSLFFVFAHILIFYILLFNYHYHLYFHRFYINYFAGSCLSALKQRYFLKNSLDCLKRLSFSLQVSSVQTPPFFRLQSLLLIFWIVYKTNFSVIFFFFVFVFSDLAYVLFWKLLSISSVSISLSVF